MHIIAYNNVKEKPVSRIKIIISKIRFFLGSMFIDPDLAEKIFRDAYLK